MEYDIRPAEIDDAPTLYGISVRAHTSSYYDKLIPATSKDDFYAYYASSPERKTAFAEKMARKIASSSWRVAVAVQNDKIIGYTIAHTKIGGKLMLRGLFVDPVQHAKGVGSALFELSLTWAQPGDVTELAVIEDNIVARRLYEHHGFTVSGPKDGDFFGAKLVIMRRIAN